MGFSAHFIFMHDKQRASCPVTTMHRLSHNRRKLECFCCFVIFLLPLLYNMWGALWWGDVSVTDQSWGSRCSQIMLVLSVRHTRQGASLQPIHTDLQNRLSVSCCVENHQRLLKNIESHLDPADPLFVPYVCYNCSSPSRQNERFFLCDRDVSHSDR